jgi:tetratricopeptide (TPR) repeat protein
MDPVASPNWRAAAVATIAVLVYLPAFRGGFVWDDLQYIQANPLLRDFRGLARIWGDPEASPQFYPLTFSTYWMEYQFWGLSPLGYHVVNVLLHAINAFLLCRLLMGLQIPGAAMVAWLFAVHPIRVESVAWITERKDVLSGFFFFATLLVWRRYRVFQDGRSYLASIGLFTCGLLAKVAICPLPVVLLLWEGWEAKRISARALVKTIPFFVLSLFLGIFHILLEGRNIGTAQASVDFSPVERLILAGRSFWFYVFKTVWPYPLMPIHPRWEIDSSDFAQILFPLSVVFLFAVLWIGKNKFGRGPFALLAFYLSMIAPVLGFASQAFYRYSFVAEHFQYLAGIGILALLVAAGIRVFAWIQIPRIAVAVSTGILIVGLSLMTWRYASLYESTETLFTHNLRHNPDSWGVHTALGATLLAEGGRLPIAIEHLETAARLNPNEAQARYNLGVALAGAGRFEEAVASYREAVRLEPNFPPAYNNLGIALEELGRYEDAIGEYERALELDPEFLPAADNRVKARLRMKFK